MSDDEFRREMWRHLVGLISVFALKFFGRRISAEQLMSLMRGEST